MKEKNKKSKLKKVFNQILPEKIEVPDNMKYHEVLRMLYDKKQVGSYYCIFQGKKLFSKAVTLGQVNEEEKSYSWEMLNKNYKRIDEKLQEYEKDKIIIRKKIPGWIAEGKKYISLKQTRQWKNDVEFMVKFWGAGCEQRIETCLQLLKALNVDKSFEKAKKILDDKHTSLDSILLISITQYCAYGKAFEEYLSVTKTSKNNLTERQI